MHDHINKAAPWEEKILPPGAIGTLTVRIFVFENQFIEELIDDKMGEAHDDIDKYRSYLIDSQRTDAPFGTRAQEAQDNGENRTKFEWFYEPVQE